MQRSYPTRGKRDLRHFYKQIQGWFHWQEWYQEAVKNAPKENPSLFIELGTWKGKSAAFMAVEIANSGKPIRFITVDTFQGSDEPAHHEDPVVRRGELEKLTRANLFPVTRHGLVTVVRSDSAEYAQQIEDGSVDFIFIDAGHTYEAVSKDIKAWWPKLRSGAVMAGDDFTWEGVRKAVEYAFGPDGSFTAEIQNGIGAKFGKNGMKCWRVEKK